MYRNVVSASTEVCAFRKRGFVCFMWPPQARNSVLCILLERGIVMCSANTELCFMQSLQVQNSVLCTVSMSMEL